MYFSDAFFSCGGAGIMRFWKRIERLQLRFGEKLISIDRFITEIERLQKSRIENEKND